MDLSYNITNVEIGDSVCGYVFIQLVVVITHPKKTPSRIEKFYIVPLTEEKSCVYPTCLEVRG